MPPSTIEPRVESSLRSAFANLESRLRILLGKLHKKEGILIRDAFNIERLDNTIRTLRIEMDALGYSEAIRRQLEGLTELHREALAESRKQGFDKKWDPEFMKESQAAIRILLRGSEQELLQVGNEAAETVSKLLRRAVMGDTEHGDILSEIQSKLQIKMHQAITLAASSLHSFSSSVRIEQAKAAGIKWFVYKGPRDPSTRPWCSHWVGLRGTSEMFEKTAHRWERGKQPTPVMAWRGGYNCRHELVPILSSVIDKYEEGPR